MPWGSSAEINDMMANNMIILMAHLWRLICREPRKDYNEKLIGILDHTTYERRSSGIIEFTLTHDRFSEGRSEYRKEVYPVINGSFRFEHFKEIYKFKLSKSGRVLKYELICNEDV